MATQAGTYLPIRPAGYKPAPVPYFKELMAAQNMLPVGILAAAASAGDDDEEKKVPSTYVESTPAMPPEDPDDLPRPPDKKEDKETIEYTDKWGYKKEIPRYVRHRVSGSLIKKHFAKLLKEKGINVPIEEFFKGLKSYEGYDDLHDQAYENAVKEIQEKGIKNISGLQEAKGAMAYVEESQGIKPYKYITYLDPSGSSRFRIDLSKLDLSKLDLDAPGYGYNYEGHIPLEAIEDTLLKKNMGGLVGINHLTRRL